VSEEGNRAETEAAQRARLGVALVAVLLLAGLVGVILLGDSSGSHEPGAAAAAPTRCLEAWNSDPEALAFGSHNSIDHGYSDVQIGFMPAEGSTTVSADPGSGECAAVFAANQLDPESLAAGQIHLEGRWMPLSDLLEPGDLALLQSAAVEQANATLSPDGTLIEK
jgi:hypothetical protein